MEDFSLKRNFRARALSVRGTERAREKDRSETPRQETRKTILKDFFSKDYDLKCNPATKLLKVIVEEVFSL